MSKLVFFEGLKEEIIRNNKIDPKFFEKYDVKQGLRDKDGTGVLAGLSGVSEVIGKEKVDWEVRPIDGILRYRGIHINDLVKDHTLTTRFLFEKITFLLLVGRMPSDEETQLLTGIFDEDRELPDGIIKLIQTVPSKTIMNQLQTAVSALYGFSETPDSLDPKENFLKSLDIIAKFPTIIAYAYLQAYDPNPVFVKPPKGKSVAESFLTMLRKGKEPSTLESAMLDLCLVLHADHGGGNNSTFTARVVTSTQSDIFSAITAAIGSLKGPLHGGANQEVMGMMDDLKANVKDWGNRQQVRDYLTKLLKKEAHDHSGKIYGMGHAVYTLSDPRALILKERAKSIAKEKGREKELGLYLMIEEEAPKLFVEIKGDKKIISPNVDFFSGYVYDCLGIPAEVYTSVFGMARVSGWASHRIEEILNGKLIRPGYKFPKTTPVSASVAAGGNSR